MKTVMVRFSFSRVAGLVIASLLVLFLAVFLTESPSHGKAANERQRFSVVISQQTRKKLVSYKAALAKGQKKPGRNLAVELRGKAIGKLTEHDFLEALLATKRPTIFAESELIGGDGEWDWNDSEISILGDVNVTVPVTVYDNGVWYPNDPYFQVHRSPFTGYLLYTPGALMASGRYQGMPPDRREVATNGRIKPAAYRRLVTRRLLPLLVFASEQAGREGKRAVVSVPGVGGGAFAGDIPDIAKHFDQAIRTMLRKYASAMPNIETVRYSPLEPINWANSNKTTLIRRKNVKPLAYLVRPHATNLGMSQLETPWKLSEGNGRSRKLRLFKVVAWDHVSLPGNDFFSGMRGSDDGVAAAATSSMKSITGIAGRYDPQSATYQPPPGYIDWASVVWKNRVKLKIRDFRGYQVVDTSAGAHKRTTFVAAKRSL